MSETFSYDAVNETQAQAIAQLRVKFTELEQAIDLFVPAGRRRSLALTNLEEAALWTNKAIVKG